MAYLIELLTVECLSFSPDVAMTLGMPQLPVSWSNDQVLGFFRLMWKQWLIKSRNGGPTETDVVRGPAPPAAVAAAAKIALSAMGGNAEGSFHTEFHDLPLAEGAPVEPAGTALLERSNSGTMIVPMFSVSSEVEISDFVDGEDKKAEMASESTSPPVATVQTPFDNAERLNRNLKWLRLHFRAIRDVGRLPFYNADLWQLHQYYLSPPFDQSDEDAMVHDLAEADGCTIDAPDISYPVQNNGPPESISADETTAVGNKRGSSGGFAHIASGPVTKKMKNVKPRIAYYPRVMVSACDFCRITCLECRRLTAFDGC
jgi:hypothetical protein